MFSFCPRGFSPGFLQVFSGFSPGFLPQSTDLHVWLIGGSKLSVGVIVSVCGPGLPCERDV